MPIHFVDLDMPSEMTGVRSALIVPCRMCPAVTVATRENKPFLRLFRRPLTSAPFDEYLKQLQSRLSQQGIRTTVFKNHLYHQWFMCLWTSRCRMKLEKQVRNYDAVIVLGCESATETVREVVGSTNVKVIDGMMATGIMNAELSFRLPDTVYFRNCEVVPLNREAH